MPAFTPVNAMVTSVDIGGGKAVIEIKNSRATMTLELAEDSGWLRHLTADALVRYTVEVIQAGVPAPDQVTSTAALESAGKEPEPPKLKVVPEPEPAAAVAQDGFANLPIDKMKDLLGMPNYEPSGPPPTTGEIFRS